MIIQTERLKEFLGCDDDFLIQLMKKFIEESGEGLAVLKSSCAEGNWPLAKSAAHKLLSSTRIFQLEELSDKLEQIEIMAGERTNTEQIPSKVIVAEKIWGNIIEEINGLLKKIPT